jgi:uncharacterized membrane protein YfhO
MKMKNMAYEGGNIKAGSNASIEIKVPEKYRKTNAELLLIADLESKGNKKFIIDVNSKNTTREGVGYIWDYPMKDYAFKINGGTENIRIGLTKGEYKVKNIRLISSSYEKYDEWIEKLNKYNLENLYIQNGFVSGDIEIGEDGTLALNIPYSNGWTAKLNGEKAETIRVNKLFTVLKLEKGRYHVEFKYVSPGFKTGAVITVVSLVISVFWWILFRKRAKIYK